jgi:hypothetical protein
MVRARPPGLTRERFNGSARLEEDVMTDGQDLQGRVALVTGATSGIGRAAAE